MGSGYCNALFDGIEIRDCGDGFYKYKVKCAKCGKDIWRNSYTRGANYICDYCKKQIRSEKRLQEIKSDSRTINEKRFDKAVDNLRKQGIDLDEYANVIEIAKSRMFDYGSTQEVMFAIEVLKRKYKISPQTKVGKYRIDFAIPTIKLLVEVDGHPFHSDDITTNFRDNEINAMTLQKWKIVHIPTSIIDKDVKKAVDIVLSNRKYKKTGDEVQN